MQLTRALGIFALGLSAMSAAEATLVNVNMVGRDGEGIQRRQLLDDLPNTSDATSSTNTSPSPTETPSSSTAEPTTSSETSPTKSPTPTHPTPTPTSRESTSSSPSPTKEAPTDHTSSSTSAQPTTSSSAAGDNSSSATVITTLVVVTTTAADGSQTTLTSETLTTATPGLAGDNSSGQNSGMSPQTRNTVIGVVVGVGGAIILGGLALVAWRIWGRKKHQEESDGLMDYGSTAEKPESGGSMTGRTPFQSTLESYHAPTQVNTAANF